jgi:hypothetical protein
VKILVAVIDLSSHRSVKIRVKLWLNSSCFLRSIQSMRNERNTVEPTDANGANRTHNPMPSGHNQCSPLDPQDECRIADQKRSVFD